MTLCHCSDGTGTAQADIARSGLENRGATRHFAVTTYRQV
jgi:hypothetical protein